jgi:antitoxin component HigA of HigAB toxin-antitoxin module
MKDIATEAEYDQTIVEINRLLRRGESNLSPEEDRLLDLLSTLAENREEAHYPITEAPGGSLIELFAQRESQRPPDWTKDIGPLDTPVFFSKQRSE